MHCYVRVSYVLAHTCLNTYIHTHTYMHTVQLADASENCAVVVVIWRACKEVGSMISIKNDSDIPITVQQANVFTAEQGKDAKDIRRCAC